MSINRNFPNYTKRDKTPSYLFVSARILSIPRNPEKLNEGYMNVVGRGTTFDEGRNRAKRAHRAMMKQLSRAA